MAFFSPTNLWFLINSVFSGAGACESFQLMLKTPELHLKKKTYESDTF